ncbi:Aste57867_2499 [Aphanomyces stellatus]|uniref:Aste57867_2499 protein n=1 Tax=Aphanomyces stellatus TaxID=120398 RepID=A0A485K7P8_9STRA|nr:hypothetical protein As57867_002492 [Aphanomyces stellatus]VFT79698.1 Aste57867_2499 [Aphanomyces stellatus]
MVNSIDEIGRALWNAAQGGYLANVRRLLDGVYFEGYIDWQDKDGWTPLYIASWNGHMDVVKLLLTKGANVNHAEKDGWTPLYIASMYGRVAIVTLLLANGALVDKATHSGATALNIAAEEGNVEVAAILLTNGADVDKATNYGATPLYQASIKGHVKVVTLLLANGANIDKPNTDGWTPLMGASYYGHLEIVQCLSNAGASLTLKHKLGKDAMEWAKEKGHSSIVALFDDIVATQARINATKTLEAVPHGFQFNTNNSEIALENIQNIQKMKVPPTPADDPVPPKFSSLDELSRFVLSQSPSTEWPLQGHYRMYSNTVGCGNHTVFHATHFQRRSKALVVKLTHQKQELEFIATMNEYQGHEQYLVECFEWGPVNVAGYNCLMVVMECGRGNCSDQLKQLQSDRFLRLRCVDHVAKAVAFMHQHDYIHGDLKLENVVDFGAYKLIDFDHSIRMGQPIPPHCTQQYCPPELAHHLRCGGPTIVSSAAFDIWCLGVLVLKLFIKDGILVEFDGLFEDDILDAISAPGFSFQRSLRVADLTGRQRWYLSKCLEPNVAKRPPSVALILKMVDMKAGVTTAVAPVQVEEPKVVACDLPCLWTVTIPRRRIPTGDQLRCLACTIGIIPMPSNVGCSYSNDAIEVAADSVAVQQLIPFLRVMRLIVEIVDFLTDEDAAEGLPFLESLPSLDALDKTIQSLVTIHDSAMPLAVESNLAALIDEFLPQGSVVDIARLRLEFIEAVQSFVQSPATQTRVAELLNAIVVTAPESVASLWGLQNAPDRKSWVCHGHGCSNNSLTPSMMPPLPAIWMLDAKFTHVPNGWQQNSVLLADVPFQVCLSCEMHDMQCSPLHGISVMGGSNEMRALLPLLKISALLLKGLTLASYYDLNVGDGFQFDFQNALRHIHFVDALDALHEIPGPRVTGEGELQMIVDRLENEELKESEAHKALEMMQQLLLQLRRSTVLVDAMNVVKMDATSAYQNGLRRVNHKFNNIAFGNVLWVCKKHAETHP